MRGKRAGRGAGRGWARWLAAAMACAVLGGCFSGGPGKIRFEEPETTPLVLDSAPATIELVGGEETQISLPRPSGGTKPYTYALKCGNVDEGDGLPAGVELDPRTGRLSGIPEDAPYSKACTYTVSDGALFGRQKKALEFWMSIRPGELFLPSVAGPTGLQVGRTMAPYALPAAQGGKAPYFYAISCEIESVVKTTETGQDGKKTEKQEKVTLAISLGGLGLKLSPQGGLEAGEQPHLSGTPTRSGIIKCSYEVSTRGAEIKRVEKPLVMEIVPPAQAKPPLKVTQEALTFSTKTPNSHSLATATGGTGNYTYALSCTPALPDTLTVAQSNTSVPPIIHGTPARNFASTCRYTATSGGESDTTTFEFTARDSDEPPPGVPTALTQENLVLSTKTPNSHALVTATGGTGSYTYALSCTPALPDTLTVAQSRTNAPPIIHGTPTANFASACRYTATSGDESATARFGITATDSGEPPPGVPATLTQGNLSFSTKTANSFALAIATGGTGTHSYALSCTPALTGTGVSVTWAQKNDKDDTSLPPILHGTATKSFASACRYSATSATSGTARAEFTVQGGEESVKPTLKQESVDFPGGKTSSVQLAGAEGGDATNGYTYTWNDCVPLLVNALFVNTTNTKRPPILYGIPGDAKQRVCSYTATDSSNSSVTASFTLNMKTSDGGDGGGQIYLRGPSFLAFYGLTECDANTAGIALGAASGGTTPYTYALQCSSGGVEGLPTGMSLTPTGATTFEMPRLAGRPGKDSAGGYSCRLSVTDTATPAGTGYVDFDFNIASDGKTNACPSNPVHDALLGAHGEVHGREAPTTRSRSTSGPGPQARPTGG